MSPPCTSAPALRRSNAQMLIDVSSLPQDASYLVSLINHASFCFYAQRQRQRVMVGLTASLFQRLHGVGFLLVFWVLRTMAFFSNPTAFSWSWCFVITCHDLRVGAATITAAPPPMAWKPSMPWQQSQPFSSPTVPPPYQFKGNGYNHLSFPPFPFEEIAIVP